MNIKAFDFHLPKYLIAQKSVKPVDSSKLLYISEEEIKDYNTFDLVNILKPGDLLIANNTKVIKSRVIGQLGQKNISITMLSEYKPGIWQALVKGSKKLGLDDKINLPNDMEISVNRKGEGGLIYFDVSISKLDFINYLNMHGELPLPPYIKTSELEDSFINYQTLFAKNYGAVAAPTAGLHFDNDLLDAITKLGVKIASVNLSVGAGTFQPVKVDNIQDHDIHSEYLEVSPEVVDMVMATKEADKKVFSVGTTATRALETAFMDNNKKGFKGYTKLFIYPGYKFKAVDRLITNFHLPKSSLLMLVSAFIGYDNMKHIYETAVDERYRFLSYGDAMLLEKYEI